MQNLKSVNLKDLLKRMSGSARASKRGLKKFSKRGIKLQYQNTFLLIVNINADMHSQHFVKLERCQNLGVAKGN
jgi:hypothetical protein